jgi:hypothetical protein
MPGRVSVAESVSMLPWLSGPILRALEGLGASAPDDTVLPPGSLCR